jgi:hypothetical protein
MVKLFQIMWFNRKRIADPINVDLFESSLMDGRERDYGCWFHEVSDHLTECGLGLLID